MAIIKMKNINNFLTDIVATYIEKGYSFYTKTMSGHQGEIAKFDMSNGEEIIRIVMERSRSKYQKEIKYDFSKFEVVSISVKSYSNFNTDILWNNEGEEINYYEFYAIGNFYSKKDIAFCDNIEEYTEIYDKMQKRLLNRYSDEHERYNIDTINNIDKILKIVNSRKGYKSIRKSQIKGYYSTINRHNKRKYYTIEIEGKNSINFRL